MQIHKHGLGFQDRKIVINYHVLSTCLITLFYQILLLLRKEELILFTVGAPAHKEVESVGAQPCPKPVH